MALLYDIVCGRDFLTLEDFGGERTNVGRGSLNCNLKVPESRKLPKFNEFYTRTVRLWNQIPDTAKNSGKTEFMKAAVDLIRKIEK